MADKTYVPGVDENFTSNTPDHPDLAERKGHGGSTAGNGTFIPDEGDESGETKIRRTSNAIKDKPVLGFLYSVSRSNFGEFWPVYLGPNTIGRSENADIVLREGTVSSEHATLIIHQEDEGEVYAGIKDNGSTHGVKVNGKSTHFDVVGCNNMDVIKIGKSYELLFVLLDAKASGLKKAENFVEVKQTATRRVDRRIITGSGSPGTSFNPGGGPSTPSSSRLSNPSASERTRSMDGEPEPYGGGTRTR
ncbi:MAG: FHA domain-containing protein [Bacteroidales bacterium]|nr:FHA domain-containing protein [Bacteroidales bacterium]